MNPIYASLSDTIFDVMSGLAQETGAVNLGQGFPEWDGPEDIRIEGRAGHGTRPLRESPPFAESRALGFA